MTVFSPSIRRLIQVWKTDIFFRTRLRLTAVYVIIFIIILLSYNARLNNELQSLSFQNGNKLSQNELERVAMEYNPYKKISQIEGENINGHNYYEVIFSDTSEIYIDAMNGKVVHEADLENSSRQILQEYMENNFFISNFLVLSLFIFLSYLLAGFSLQPLKRSLLLQQRFSKEVTYELTHPLMAIQSAADNALSKNKRTLLETDEVLHNISHQSQRVSTLSKNLITLLQHQTSPTPFVKVHISSLIQKLIKQLIPTARDLQVTFETHIESFSCFADKELMEILIFHLIQNALYFSQAGQKVIISLCSHGVLSVQDFGIGIAPQYISNIFKANQKKTHSKKYSAGGSGLGLSLIREIARLHHDEVVISSNIGKGSLFKVLLSA